MAFTPHPLLRQRRIFLRAINMSRQNAGTRNSETSSSRSKFALNHKVQGSTMKIATLLTFLCAALQASMHVESFNIRQHQHRVFTFRENHARPSHCTPGRHPLAQQTSTTAAATTATTTALLGTNSNVDGAGRGSVILAVVLVIVVWGFSIPTEFRRAHFCAGLVAGTDTPCTQNRAACYDCVTFDEWKGGIVQYYKNGGGVKFDFTIDPATTKANEQMLNSVMKR